MNLRWINEHESLESIIRRFNKVEKLLKKLEKDFSKANKELELIRYFLNLR